MGGPLSGMRVVDLTDDRGRFATKLLAEVGARVVRVHDGSGVSHGPDMVDPGAAARGGLLDWWYDGAKTSVPLDLARAADADSYRRLVAGADLVVETAAPGRLAELGLDHADLAADHPALVQVSLTPFGRTGPRAQWQGSDLVAGALGGVLSVSGTPDRAINPWGRQNLHFGSFVAAITGLAAVRHARRTGQGQLVDVSLHEVVASSTEQLWFQYFYDDVQTLDKIAPRQGSLHWTRAYVVAECRTGWCMTTPTPAPARLFEWMAEQGVEGATERTGMDLAELLADVDAVIDLTRSFAAAHDAGDLFQEAQARHVAFGEVQSVAQVAANPQLAFRGFFTDTAPDADGVHVTRPRHPVVYGTTRLDLPAAPLTATADEILATWGARAAAGERVEGAAPDGKPLDGVRVLDLTHVLAGPFCCRMLGDLGADVVKVHTAGRATAVNSPEHPFFPCWNRSRRSVALDLKHGDAPATVRALVEQADVLIENYSAGVLDRLGLDFATVHGWNPRLVYVTMPGCGHDGPWSRMVTYAPTIHALCGLTALSNPPGRGDVGAGFSLNDHAVGFTAAFSILAALEARRGSEQGQHVDISQLEVGAYLVGSALTDHLTNGRDAQATGNLDPYADHVVNDVFPTRDGEVAVTVRDAAEAAVVATVIGTPVEVVRDGLSQWCAGRSATEAMDTLQRAGVAAGRVQNADHLFTDDEQLAARGFFAMMPSTVFGARPFERFPARFGTSVLEPYRPAPNYVGEHAFEVLGELAGMDDAAVALAMADGLLA